MEKFRLLFLFIPIVGVLLLSCNENIEGIPQSQASQTYSLTPQPIPSSTATPTFSPLEATRYTSALTYAPTGTAKVQNNIDDCDGYPDDRLGIHDRLYSQSGTWYIAYCQYPITNANYTKIINTKNNSSWEVPYLDRDGQNRPEGMTGGQMVFENWSFDEKFVYFTRYFCCVDGPGIEFSYPLGLYKLNLGNGEIVELESGSLSPDGYSLVFDNFGKHQIIVKNLSTRQVQLFDIDEKFELAGMFQWSPDGSKIAFSAADENWFEEKSGFAMYLIDLTQNRIKQILLDFPGYYIAETWRSDEEILVVSYRGPVSFLYDIETGELISANSESLTLTPSP